MPDARDFLRVNQIGPQEDEDTRQLWRGESNPRQALTRWTLHASQRSSRRDFVLAIQKGMYEEKDIAQDLVLGNIKDWNQYQHLVGEARGLSLAKEEIKSLLENNVEDAEQIITS